VVRLDVSITTYSTAMSSPSTTASLVTRAAGGADGGCGYLAQRKNGKQRRCAGGDLGASGEGVAAKIWNDADR
jgi:hypothetical protein